MWKSVALALLLLLPAGLSAQKIAFSFDDGLDPLAKANAAHLNSAILRALEKNKVRGLFFVAGSRVDSKEGLALVRDWSKAGHAIANHSYAHLNFNNSNISLDAFIDDAQKNERLLSQIPGYEKRFRFPYLKEGNTEQKRDGFRKWLSSNNYKSGAVSVDTSDWYYDLRLRKWLENNPKRYPSSFRQPYLDHLLDRATSYSNLAKQVVGRDVPHVMLLHTNTINAYFLADVVAMFRAAGWQVVDPSEAYRDSIYSEKPQVLPAGESLVWSLAKQAGVPGLRYPAEDGSYEQSKLDALGL